MRNFILFLFVLSATNLFGQSFHGTSTRVELASEAFGKDRSIDVYTPYFYEQAPADSVMVIYVFDGQYDPYFTMTSHIAEYLGGMSEIPSFIVVGIHTEHRPKEFTPEPRHQSTREGWGETPVGESAKLKAFLLDDVFPYIESNYRTNGIRFGIGHSLGGTFVSETVFANTGMFKGVISISPNTSYDDRHLAETLDNTLTSGETVNAFHYMTAGTVGNMENNFRNSSNVCDSIYRAHPQEGFIWEYETYTGKNHSTTVPASISEGLLAFGEFFLITEQKAEEILEQDTSAYADNIKLHYAGMSEWLGMPYTPDITTINWLGYIAMGEEHFEEAMKLFDWGISEHPNDANIYDSRGEALENLGRYKEAKESYELAVEKLEAEKDIYDAETYEYYQTTFQENADRAKGLAKK